MNLITTKKFELFTETDVLIKGLSFSLSAGEKIALIGRNGSGKSSFLNVINYLVNNKDKPDYLSWNGEISVNSKLKCYYLSQEIKLSFDGTVDEFLNFKLIEQSSIYDEYHGLLSRSSGNQSGDFEKRLEYLSGEMDNRNLWNFPEKKNEILENFKFTANDRLRNLSELSGGEVVRLALAAIMLVNPDLILLDEPTNNLDSHQIEYLKDFVLKSKTGLLIVSHDRYFLDAVINKIIEIDEYSHEAKVYGGNYSFYKQQKTLAYDVQERLYEDQNKKRNRLGRYGF